MHPLNPSPPNPPTPQPHNQMINLKKPPMPSEITDSQIREYLLSNPRYCAVTIKRDGRVVVRNRRGRFVAGTRHDLAFETAQWIFDRF